MNKIFLAICLSVLVSCVGDSSREETAREGFLLLKPITMYLAGSGNGEHPDSLAAIVEDVKPPGIYLQPSGNDLVSDGYYFIGSRGDRIYLNYEVLDVDGRRDSYLSFSFRESRANSCVWYRSGQQWKCFGV